MFKKSKPPSVLAATCDNCKSPEPSAPITITPLPLGEISTDITKSHESKNSFQIKIEKSFWGSYFYRDENGKKVKLKKQEAFNLMTRLRMERIGNDINQKITERTQDTIHEQRRTLNTGLEKRLNERVQENQDRKFAAAFKISVPTVNPQCVERSLNKLRPGTGNKRACQSDLGNGIPMRTTPCITKEISEYIAWSINRAFECINDSQDPLNANLFFKMLNLESSFNFWHQNPKTGKGIGQLTFLGVQEVLGSSYDTNTNRYYKHDGRLMLERIMQSNPKCDIYKHIANPNLPNNQSMYPRPYNENNCALVSMDTGIQRNLLASIALYKFYRDEQRIYSSEKVLRDLGIPRSNPDYIEMKNILALMSCSHIGSQRARTIALSMKSRIKPNISLNQFRDAINKGIDLYNGGKKKEKRIQNYLKAIDNKFNAIVNDGDTLICSGSY